MSEDWRNLPPTQKQLDALEDFGIEPAKTRGECSDQIGEAIKKAKAQRKANALWSELYWEAVTDRWLGVRR